MHPDKNTVLQAKKIIYAHLKRLQLEINQDKEQLLYLTKAGRPCEDHCFTGTSTINYLGYGFNANGYTGLKKGKTQKLIQTVRTRLQRICNALSGLKLKKKAKILSQHLVSTLHTQSYETLYYQQQMNKISDPKRKHQLHLQLSHEISTMCTGNSDTALFFHLKYCVCLPIVSQIEA